MQEGEYTNKYAFAHAQYYALSQQAADHRGMLGIDKEFFANYL